MAASKKSNGKYALFEYIARFSVPVSRRRCGFSEPRHLGYGVEAVSGGGSHQADDRQQVPLAGEGAPNLSEGRRLCRQGVGPCVCLPCVCLPCQRAVHRVSPGSIALVMFAVYPRRTGPI